MNFSGNSRDDKARHAEQTLIIGSKRGMRRSHRVAHGIVLARKQVLQQGDSHPAVERITDQVGASGRIAKQAAFDIGDVQLAIAAGASAADGGPVLAVQKAGIPPVRADVVEKAVGAALGGFETKGSQRASGGAAV